MSEQEILVPCKACKKPNPESGPLCPGCEDDFCPRCTQPVPCDCYCACGTLKEDPSEQLCPPCQEVHAEEDRAASEEDESLFDDGE